MANDSATMSEAEISDLKETLCAQQTLLQKLYNELDAERESSATAASEALSVILRLQGEKAAVKMEAEQFKRLAEEKMCHAEEYFAIIEDIIYQKEMEVADLHFQVQSYRYKLLSLGALNPGVGEIKLPENLLQRNEGLAADHPSPKSMGRRNSLPSLLIGRKAVTEKEYTSPIPEMDLDCKSKEDEETNQETNDSFPDAYKKTDNSSRLGITCYGEEIRELDKRQETNESFPDADKKTDNSTRLGITCYGEEIRELDKRVNKIAGTSYTTIVRNDNIGSPSTSLPSRFSASNLCYLASLNSRSTSPHAHEASKINEIDRIILPSIPQKKCLGSDNHPSSNVHDVFEVPQAESSSRGKKDESNEGMERENVIHPGAGKVCAKEEPEWLKKLLKHSSSREKNLCKLGDLAASTSIAESQVLDQVSRTLGEVYDKIAESNNREEEMKLLEQINEKINLVHDEVRSLKVKRSTESSSSPLPEAMLSFWL